MARTDLAAQKTAAEPMKDGETRTINGVTVRCEGIAQGSTPKCVLYRLVLVGMAQPGNKEWAAANATGDAVVAALGYQGIGFATEQAADGWTWNCKVIGQRNRIGRRWF